MSKYKVKAILTVEREIEAESEEDAKQQMHYQMYKGYCYGVADAMEYEVENEQR